MDEVMVYYLQKHQTDEEKVCYREDLEVVVVMEQVTLTQLNEYYLKVY